MNPLFADSPISEGCGGVEGTITIQHKDGFMLIDAKVTTLRPGNHIFRLEKGTAFRAIFAVIEE